ncbi:MULTISPECIES: twin-arginine translocation signal domain-containing protein [Haloferax]|uniref:twin-arginine translocation signal domain-containing protein n=1 Tax=Haloferax TaxID=2251 RepID=UPI00374357E2
MVNRRTYLKTLGSVGVGASLAGCGQPREEETSTLSTPQETTTTPEPKPRETVYDAVEDIGMDPTGQDPIDDLLDDVYGDDTIVQFPPGEYLITRKHDWDRGVSNFQLVGLGDSHKDVQFVFPPNGPGEEFRMLRITSGDHHVLKNFSIQQTDDDTTSADIWLANDDGALIEDVEWLGRTPSDDNARDQLLLFDCTSVDGVNIARRVYMREGAVIPGYPDGVAGIRITGRSIGEVKMIDCHIEQRGSSSFRATHTRGVLRVEGGLFKNNDNTNMRISGGDHPSKQSWIKGATMVVDADNLNEHAQPGDRLHSPSGLLVDSTGNGYSGLLIEDCDFIYKSSPAGRGVISTSPPSWGGHGSFTLRNCRIQNDTSIQTIHADSVDTSETDTPWGMTLENVTITGQCSEQPFGSAVVIGENRNGSKIVDSCIYLPNGNVDGVLVEGAEECSIANSTINVSGTPTRTRGGSLSLQNVSYTEGCAFRDAL